MASISKGYTFGATETVTADKLHDLVDLASITGIVNADIDASANIDSTKINLASAGYMTTGNNYTITGTHTYSTAPILPASTVDAITEIAAALKSGVDTTLVTGTKGTTNYTAKWNVDGDLVDGYEVKDEDTMVSNSATAICTQQSIKAYVDTSVASTNMRLLSTTTLSSATNSGDISITAGRKYFVFFELTAGGDAVTATELRFDSDSTATDYAWLKTSTQWSASPSPSTTGDDSDDSIVLSAMAANTTITGNFVFDSNADANNQIYVRGSYMNVTGAGTFFTEFFGAYKDAGTLTDFEMFADHNVSGTIKTYEII